MEAGCTGGGTDGAPLSTWWALSGAVAHIAQRLERDVSAAVGLPVLWVDTLLALQGAGDCGLPMTDLAGRVSFSSGGFTRLADRLEAAGLVERRACPGNRRSTLVVLTAAGRDVLDRALPVYAGSVRRHLHDVLGSEAVRALGEDCEHLRTAARVDDGGA